MDVRLAAIAVAIAITFDGDVSAGPFVQGVPQPLNAEIAASRAAVVARAIRPGDETAGWRVERVLHDTTGRVAVGQTIQPDVDEPMHDGVALVISRVDRTVSARPLSAEAQTYLISLPQLNASRDEAVRFATRHLASHDPVISEDVFAMLSQFGAAELLALRETLPADKLRELVNSEETPSHRLGLYGYLLGLCGDPRDATWLRRRLLREEELSIGADGLAAGYLLLTGEDGLTDLESTILVAEQGTPMLVAAFLESLRVLETSHPSLFSRERLQEVGICALGRADAADLAIGYLAQQRHWESLPAVTALLNSEDEDLDRRRAVQVASVRFLLACRRDTDTSIVVRAKAEELLGRIADLDSDLLRRASHLAGELPAQR